MSKIPNTGKAVIKFYATWCGPCKNYSPIFSKVESKYADSGIKFIEIDIDENPEIANEYGVMGVPATVFVQDRKEIGRLMGYQPLNNLIAFIDKLKG